MTSQPTRPEDEQPRAPAPSFPEIEPGSKSQASLSSSMRGIVDALLQGSLVDLFQGYGVAIAPLPRDGRVGVQRYPELSASIGFTSASDGKCPNASGRLTLSLPVELVEAMQVERAQHVRDGDWVRELVNQLMGRFKNRLLPYGARLRAGLPSSIGRDALETLSRPVSSRRIYRARTLRGEVVATLEGTLNEAELAYVGHASIAAEGEVILF